jgi:hypothetical protein
MTEYAQSLLEEDKKLRRLRFLADFTAQVLAQEKLTIDEALDLINGTRRAALNLFPGKGETFDMIYGRRFQRILRERFASPGRTYALGPEEDSD